MIENSVEPQDMFGDKLYQCRARRALPILVRQALSENPIYYGDLATELGMTNPRNLNMVLGSIGVTLEFLANEEAWNQKIPKIESLVINKSTGVPGLGFENFLSNLKAGYENLPRPQKQGFLRLYWAEVYAYPFWNDVLRKLCLRRLETHIKKSYQVAQNGSGRGRGEGPEHLKLKRYVCRNPNAVGLASSFPKGQEEVELPSGDKIDAFFSNARKKLAVEVKSYISNEGDIKRGLFQCVKYLAVMKAERGYNSETYDIDALLVVGKTFPKNLQALKNSLGVQVIELTNFHH